MKRIVVDCSVVMAWCFEDEADEYADSVLDSLTDSEMLAPSVWPLEVANVLLVAECMREEALYSIDIRRHICIKSAAPSGRGAIRRVSLSHTIPFLEKRILRLCRNGCRYGEL